MLPIFFSLSVFIAFQHSSLISFGTFSELCSAVNGNEREDFSNLMIRNIPDTQLTSLQNLCKTITFGNLDNR